MRISIAVGVKAKLLLFFSTALTLFGLLATSAQADIRVLAAGGDIPHATEEVFANGKLIGHVDRPAWDVYRELTTKDIVENYDVLLIPYNTQDWEYDYDWNTRVLPFLASGGGVIWEGATSGAGGIPLIQSARTRYVCPDGTICYIPDSPLTVLPVPGLTDGITSDFTFTTGYLTSWDSRLTPFLQADAVGLGTISYGVYGEIDAGRIVITENAQDESGLSTGTAAEVNAYNLLANKLQWAASSTLPPNPNLRFVPSLVGLTEADAVTALQNLGFVTTIYYTISNDDISGNVVAQDQQPGDGGFVGDTITMFVVAPPTGPEVTVPDVTNMVTADAITTLNAVGLEQGTLVWNSDPIVPSGSIITQNPVPGNTSYEGWSVDMVESTGPNPGSVPFVKYESQTKAETVLAAAGYVTGTITTQNHNVIPAGYVISQSPWEGATLAAGSAVDLVISAGLAGTTLVSVPSVVGLAQADAETALTNAGLTSSVTTAFNDTVAAGVVISQTPAAATDVASGSVVDLVVSAGPAPATVAVPDVIGLSQTAAQTTITDAGLVVGTVSTASSSTVAAGNVISQTPAAATNVAPGSAVGLVVSTGPALILVPAVTGLTQGAAETAITSAGLAVGNVTTANSDTVPTGDVISQTPGAGTEVTAGSSVDLVVSSGPALVIVPDVVGLTYSTATANIGAAGLTVGSVSTTLTRRSCGVVRSQTPAGGASVSAGTAVNLVVTRTRTCNPL